ncbi:MAG: hypothetical protein E7583_06020 [Ruminococcaceae bacterium]|nr:hypothetical protein [Oscillospiraceae bacterium]
MKKNKALALAMASVALTGMISGCEDPGKNDAECIYGPPPADEEITGEYDLPEPIYGPPNMEEFDPAENEPVDVYGPPIAEEEPTE